MQRRCFRGQPCWPRLIRKTYLSCHSDKGRGYWHGPVRRVWPSSLDLIDLMNGVHEGMEPIHVTPQTFGMFDVAGHVAGVLLQHPVLPLEILVLTFNRLPFNVEFVPGHPTLPLALLRCRGDVLRHRVAPAA